MSKKQDWMIIGTIQDPERRQMWIKVFEEAQVPILYPRPIQADLPDHPQANIYMLNLAAIEPEQLQKVIELLAEKFGLEVEEVRKEVLAHGVPILAEGVNVETTPGIVVPGLNDQVIELRDGVQRKPAAFPGLEEIDGLENEAGGPDESSQ